MANKLLAYTLTIVFIIINTTVINAQEIKKSFAINLKSGTILPQKMENLPIVNQNSKYFLLQFEALPKPSDLKQLGISSLNYVDNKTIFAKIENNTDLNNISNLRWVSKLQPKDRISRYAENVINDNPQAKKTFVISAQKDISTNLLEEMIINAGGIVSNNKSFPEYVRMCTGDKSVIEKLKSLEEVNWISVASPALQNNEDTHFCHGAMTEYGPIGDFVVHDDGWDGAGLGSADLTYYFSNGTPDISSDEEKQEIVNAFAEWAKYVDINFTETNLANQNKSIDILWGSGEHGDGFAFDGPSNVLAHCFYPAPPNPEPIAGDMHFDEDEFWSQESNINLFAVALHEIGHGLGINHSDDPNAIMYAYYRGPVDGLTSDDIAAAKSIYAERSENKMPVTLLLPSNNEGNVSLTTVLSWSTVFEATSYNLLVSENNDFTNIIADESVITTNYNLSGLEKYNNYYWKVQANNNGEFGDWSEVFRFTTEGTPVMTLLSPENNAKSLSRSVRFSWDIINEAQSYRLQIASDSLFRDIEVNSVITDTTYTRNFLYNKNYYWRVYATLSEGITGWSETRTFQTELEQARLSYPANNISGISVMPNFVWFASDGAEYYSFQISEDQEFTSIVVSAENIQDLSYTVTESLQNSTKYFWRVKSFDRNGNYSQWCTARNFTTIFSPTVLTSPANGSEDLVLITELVWENVEFASYWLQVAKDDEFSSLVVNKNNHRESNYELTNLDENTQYSWRVKTIDNGAASDWSEIWKFTTGTPPTTIKNDIVEIDFKHNEGHIEQLKYKKGSAKDLINPGMSEKYNGGLERIVGEINSKCINWSIKDTGEGIDSAVFVYQNSTYGTKTFVLRWSQDIGFEMDVEFNINRAKTYTSSTYWKPGGNNASIYDSLRVINQYNQPIDKYVAYTDKDEDLFKGIAYAVGFYDTRFDEVAGYKYSVGNQITITNGKEKFNVKNTFEGVGTHRIKFAIKNKDDFWKWSTGEKDPALAVKYPSNGTIWNIGNTNTIEWSSSELNDNINIKLSLDGGKTFSRSLADNVANTGNFSIKVPNAPSSDCVVLIESSDDPAIHAKSSGIFTITEPGSVFFIMPDSIISAPGQLVNVPFIIKPNGNNVGAFDAKINFNNEVLIFDQFIYGNTITTANGWKIGVNDSSAAGWIQVGAYANDAFFTEDEIAVTLVFQVNSNALVGTEEKIIFDTDHVSAADSNAYTLQVTSDNGSIIFHTMCAGRIRYYSNNEPIAGATLRLDASNPDFVLTQYSSSEGTYLFSPVKPGGSAVLHTEMERQIDMRPLITAGDALKAFRGRANGPDQLTPYEKIAANVNNDNLINSTDAFAILRRSTGAFKDFADFNLNDWAFVDAEYNINQDNWQETPTEITFEPLNDISISKDIIAVIRGNVLGTYTRAMGNVNPGPMIIPTALSKTSGTPAYINLGEDLYKDAGDIIEVPVTINPNRKELGSLDFKIVYDKQKLTFVSHSDLGDVIPSDNKWITDLYCDTSGVISFGGFLSSNVTLNEEGTVFSIQFRVNDNVEDGDSCEVGFLMASSTDSLANLIGVEHNGMNVRIGTPTDVSINDEIPTKFSLSQNYPNPFNPSTNVKFTLPKAGNVSIKIYNSIGQEVTTLVNEFFNEGIHKITFNANGLASGVYFYRIHVRSDNKAAEFVEVKRMILLK